MKNILFLLVLILTSCATKKELEINIKNEEKTNELNMGDFADIESSEGHSYEDDVQELDLDEIKNDINQAISEKLSKYFK